MQEYTLIALQALRLNQKPHAWYAGARASKSQRVENAILLNKSMVGTPPPHLAVNSAAVCYLVEINLTQDRLYTKLTTTTIAATTMLATLTQLQALFWELQNPTVGSWGDAGRR